MSHRIITIHRGDTYEQLCRETISLAGTLMVEAVDAWTRGALCSVPQGPGKDALKIAPPEVLEVVYRKLREGTYKHFVN